MGLMALCLLFCTLVAKEHAPGTPPDQEQGPYHLDNVLEMRPLTSSPIQPFTNGTKVTPGNENENCVGWTIDAGLLKQRVEHLVPAFLGRDPTYVSTFLGTYPTFTTTQQVLEVLFMRYGCFHSEAEEDGGPREQEKL
uniref:ral guanine nucleotide dissociation stimulator-like n=1 Tax=Panthera onca TaxID=9690 RepID=UPI00295343E1|nr:ral guanine nucleotide dissociation stimulator-like [Panthera onca]